MKDWINHTTQKEQQKINNAKTLKTFKEFICVAALGAVMAVGFVYGLDNELDSYESTGQQVATDISKLKS